MRLSILVFLVLATSCAPKEQKFDEDYVLIEFASKLEEEQLKRELEFDQDHHAPKKKPSH